MGEGGQNRLTVGLIGYLILDGGGASCTRDEMSTASAIGHDTHQKFRSCVPRTKNSHDVISRLLVAISPVARGLHQVVLRGWRLGWRGLIYPKGRVTGNAW